MVDCIFCQIVKGKLPSYKIYEDEDFLAFLDISQIVDGHTLLIPKKHVRWVWDLPAGRRGLNIGQFFETAQKIVKHFQKVTGEEFVMSVTLGVMVKHAHLHLLPKTEGNVDKVWDAWVEAREARKVGGEKMKILAKRFCLTDGDLELRS